MKITNIFMGLVLIAVGVLGVGAWQLGFFLPAGPAHVFVVQKNENFVHIAHRLEAQRIIKSSRALRWYVSFWGSSKKLQRGEFAVVENMPIPELVSALTEGKPIEYKFTIPEGYNMFQVAEMLQESGFGTAQEFLKIFRSPEITSLIPTADKNGPKPLSVEGYLFPDTYLLQKVYSPHEIVQLMLMHFREEYRGWKDSVAGNAQLKALGLSAADVVTLASIVEKETGAAAERPLIASIFLNRLQKHMRLQTDPTVIYGIWEKHGSFDGKIHKSDLLTPTDYNTYVINRLPPGPIANPGKSAVEAVLKPATSEYLYFVSQNNGTHVFSKNYEDHQRAVNANQLNPAAREGKSWRDLPKSERAK